MVCCIVGARVDVEDKEGNTALHIAARHGHASVVKTLIAFGASVLKLVQLYYIQTTILPPPSLSLIAPHSPPFIPCPLHSLSLSLSLTTGEDQVVSCQSTWLVSVATLTVFLTY